MGRGGIVPTRGVTDTQAILANVREANRHTRAAIFRCDGGGGGGVCSSLAIGMKFFALFADLLLISECRSKMG